MIATMRDYVVVNPSAASKYCANKIKIMNHHGQRSFTNTYSSNNSCCTSVLLYSERKHLLPTPKTKTTVIHMPQTYSLKNNLITV